MDYLAENRVMNWAGVSDDAPAFVKAYVTEFRSAQIEKRNISPVFLKSHTAGIEQRSAVASAALRSAARLFPTTKRTNEDAALRSIAHRQAAELREDQKVLSRARLDAEARREAEALAESVAAFNAATFPWERRN
jgi:hypothetical protein